MSSEVLVSNVDSHPEVTVVRRVGFSIADTRREFVCEDEK